MYIRKPDTTLIRVLPKGEIFVMDLNYGNSVIYESSAWSFLKSLDARPRHIDELLKEVVMDYNDMTFNDLRNDAIELYKDLETRGMLVVSTTKDEIDTYTLTTLQIEITTACNERCRHCYIPDRCKDKNKYMPMCLFTSLIDDFTEMGGKEVTITGGEPMTHPLLSKMLSYCADKGLRINLFSNLISLDSKLLGILDQLPIGIIQTSVYSLDSELHDHITGVQGSLGRTLFSIEELVKKGINVQIACPVMKTTEPGIEKLLKYAKNLGLNIRLNPLLTAKTDYDGSCVLEQRLSPEESLSMFKRMMDYDKDYTLKYVLNISDIDTQLIDKTSDFINSPLCSAGIDHCCIAVNGNVYPCPDWDKFILGNVLNNSLADIWYSSPNIRMLRLQNKQKYFPKCMECSALSFCKRCLMQNELEKQGDMFTCHESTCQLAFITKLIYDEYQKEMNTN